MQLLTEFLKCPKKFSLYELVLNNGRANVSSHYLFRIPYSIYSHQKSHYLNKIIVKVPLWKSDHWVVASLVMLLY